MNSTKIYLYHQRHRVVLLDTSGAYFSRRYRQVYTKNLTAHRGTDNRILIEFVNQDQKRVDLRDKTVGDTPIDPSDIVPGDSYVICELGNTDWKAIGASHPVRKGNTFIATGVGSGTGVAKPVTYADMDFTCRLISHDGDSLLLEKPLAVVNRTAGQTNLVLTEEELDLIAPGKIGFSIEYTSDNALFEPVFVDDNAGARGIIDVVDSIMPSFTDSEVLTIPTGQVSPRVSSTLNTDASDLHTFQITMDNFTGTIETSGATDTDGNWYSINTDVVAESDVYVYTVEGYHPYIQFTFTEGTNITAGSFTIDNEYTIETVGTTDFTLIGALDNVVGIVFTATGVGAGDGTATSTDPEFPGTVTEIRHR